MAVLDSAEKGSARVRRYKVRIAMVVSRTPHTVVAK